MTRGHLVWIGQNERSAADDKYLRLYLRAWRNPDPLKEVVSMDIVCPQGGLFCIAITIEEPPSDDGSALASEGPE